VRRGDPALFIDIDDQTIAGAMSPTGPKKAPLATAPRGVIADALEYVRAAPPGKGAAAAILDTDLATPTPATRPARPSCVRSWPPGRKRRRPRS
jgi:hypothetical protein